MIGLLKNLYHCFEEFLFKIATIISPELNTRLRYRKAFKKKMDLSNPITLNDKILWLKLNYNMNNPLVVKCADKVAVRDYVKSCGCEEILIDLIGVYNSAKEIPWEALPNEFVLKWNFGAGMNIVCTDKTKMDKNDVISQMEKWGKSKYWLSHSEMQYKDMPKRIICEKLIRMEELI